MEKINNNQEVVSVINRFFESILESKDKEMEGLKKKNADLTRNLSKMDSMKTKLKEKVCFYAFDLLQPYQ